MPPSSTAIIIQTKEPKAPKKEKKIPMLAIRSSRSASLSLATGKG